MREWQLEKNRLKWGEKYSNRSHFRKKWSTREQLQVKIVVCWYALLAEIVPEPDSGTPSARAYLFSFASCYFLAFFYRFSPRPFAFICVCRLPLITHLSYSFCLFLASFFGACVRTYCSFFVLPNSTFIVLLFFKKKNRPNNRQTRININSNSMRRQIEIKRPPFFFY